MLAKEKALEAVAALEDGRALGGPENFMENTEIENDYLVDM